MSKFDDQSWDRDCYETGRTRPPKDHTGLVAILLVLVLAWLGYSTAVGNFGSDREKAQETTAPTLSAVAETEPRTAAYDSLTPETKATAPDSLLSDYRMEIAASPASVPNVPQEGGLSLQEIYRQTIDSVVSITTQGNDGSATGTGVILSSDGYIVTNCHVVEDGLTFAVLLSDSRSFDAALVGMDRVSDLAVLKIEASGLQSAQFGDSSSLQVGDSVVAIGDPLGIRFRGTMTDGIVSAINRDVTVDGRTMTLIQTNAALNSGNSGGPLLNCYGQVVGINTMKISNSVSAATVEGLGFAIPSVTVREIVQQLISQGYVSGRPSLGFSCENVSSFYQLYYHLPAGVYVTELLEGSPAAEAGLRESDILLYFDGERIRSTDDLTSLLYVHEAGDPVEVVVYRKSGQVTLTICLEEATG